MTKLTTRWNCVHWHILSLCSPLDAYVLCIMLQQVRVALFVSVVLGSFMPCWLSIICTAVSFIVYHEVGLVQALLVQWFRLENSTDYGGICECLSVFETGFKVDWLSQYELFHVAQQLWNTCFFFFNQFIFSSPLLVW